MKKAFKVLAMFLMVASMAALSSCSKKDSIVGKWQYAGASIETTSEAPEVQEYIDQIVALYDIAFADMVWEFKEDGTLLITGGIIEWDEEDEKVTYTVDGDKLIINGGDYEGEDIIIETLTSKKLVLSMTEDDEDFGAITELIEFSRI